MRNIAVTVTEQLKKVVTEKKVAAPNKGTVVTESTATKSERTPTSRVSSDVGAAKGLTGWI